MDWIGTAVVVKINERYQVSNPAGSARILSQIVNSFQGVRNGFQEAKTRLYKDIQKTGNDGPLAGVHRTYEKR